MGQRFNYDLTDEEKELAKVFIDFCVSKNCFSQAMYWCRRIGHPAKIYHPHINKTVCVRCNQEFTGHEPSIDYSPGKPNS